MKYISNPAGPQRISDPEELRVLQTKHKATIGIAGLDPNKVAELTKLIIAMGLKIGLSDDQHFPEIIAVGIDPEGDPNKMRDQIHFCADQGCDVIAVTNTIKLDGVDRGLEVVCGDDLEAIAKEVLLKALDKADPIRPKQCGFSAEELLVLGKTEEAAIMEAVSADYALRESRVKARQAVGGYSFLEKVRHNLPVTGILGGAGPEASATFAAMLAHKAVPFIHFSVNSAPGKHRFEVEGGSSYIPHYAAIASMMNLLSLDRIAVPCNTAHKRLNEYLPQPLAGHQLKLVDIREGALNAALKKRAKGTSEIILFGTSATTGVNLPKEREGEKGVYAIFLETKQGDDLPPVLLVPNAEEQDLITEAIYNVKAGKYDEAKSKILAVIFSMRERFPECPIILGCTELPLPFSAVELMELKLIDPAREMTTVLRHEISKSRDPFSPAAAFRRDSNSSSGSSSDSSDDSLLSGAAGSGSGYSSDFSPSSSAAAFASFPQTSLSRPQVSQLASPNVALYRAKDKACFPFLIEKDQKNTYRIQIIDGSAATTESLKEIEERFRGGYTSVAIYPKKHISFRQMNSSGIEEMNKLAAEYRIGIVEKQSREKQ